MAGVVDPLPATYTWTVDTIAPAAPGNFAASATSPFSVALSWTAATDNLGVTGYDILRDGTLLATIPPATSYTDTAVVGSTQYSYQIRARDVAGNLSGLGAAPAVTTPAPPVPVFADGFESGNLSAWSPTSGLIVEGSHRPRRDQGRRGEHRRRPGRTRRRRCHRPIRTRTPGCGSTW